MNQPQVNLATVPWPIKAYGWLYAIGFLAYLVLSDEPFQGIAYSLLEGLVLWGMVRGSRVAWVIAVIFSIFAVVWTVGVAVGQGPSDIDVKLKVIQGANALISFGLLLHPQTREWCRRKLRLQDP